MIVTSQKAGRQKGKGDWSGRLKTVETNSRKGMERGRVKLMGGNEVALQYVLRGTRRIDVR